MKCGNVGLGLASVPTLLRQLANIILSRIMIEINETPRTPSLCWRL
jgi:hypothetical protein